MPENFKTEQQPVLRRRKSDKGIEEVRIKDGEKTIISEKNDRSIISEQEKKAIKNKAIEKKLQEEIRGFLAQKK